MKVSTLKIVQKVLSVSSDSRYTDFELSIFQDFWNVLLDLSDLETSELLSSLTVVNRKEIYLKWNRYIKELEKNKVEGYLKGKTVADISILEKEGYTGVLCEFDLIKDLSNRKRCLMAGSGYHPETLMELKKNYKNIIPICLDYDEEALKSSKAYIKQAYLKEISNEFIFIKEKSYNFSYHKEDVILIANGLSNKKETLIRIKSTASKNINILLRLPQKTASLLYEDISDADIKKLGFDIISKIQPSALSKTYLIRESI